MKRIIVWAAAAGLGSACRRSGAGGGERDRGRAARRVHKVLSSYDVLGGPATNTAVYATKRFKDGNPKAYQAVVTGLQEAIEQINKDKRAAAAIYQRMTGTKESVDDIYAMIAASEVEMTFRTRR